MIELSATDASGISAAIDASLDRLRTRSSVAGDAAAALAEACTAAASNGKRLRPALVVAGYRAFASVPSGSGVADRVLWQIAAAFELLHTAFVVHDDLIDRDLERRGAPTVAARFHARALAAGAPGEQADLVGDAAAVLAGDLLLFEATRLVATAELDSALRTRLLEIFDDAILVSASGELSDVENAAVREIPGTDALLAAARDKTAAYSFVAPLACGAALAGASTSAQGRLSIAAGELGLAFQLVDDLIGTFGTRAQAGREPGADLRAIKRTPLIGLAREGRSWPHLRSVLALAHTGPIAIRKAQRELEASGARGELVDLVMRSLMRARSAADSDDVPPAALALVSELADSVERRIP